MVEELLSTILEGDLLIRVREFATTIVRSEVLRFNSKPPEVGVLYDEIGTQVRPVRGDLADCGPARGFKVRFKLFLELVFRFMADQVVRYAIHVHSSRC